MKTFAIASALIFSVGSFTTSHAGPYEGTKTVSSTIDSSLPEFRFQIRTDRDGYIEWIDIFSPSGRKTQSIQFPDDAEEPCSSCNLLEFEDLNFDGYNDLLLLVGWGSGGSMYDVWIYNPKKTAFEKASFDTEFANPSVDTKNKVLMTSSPMGCCAGTNYYYRYNKGKFRLFKQEDYSVENKRDVVVVRELVRGKWRVTKKYGDYRE